MRLRSILVGVALVTGCTASQGDACRIDSDCEAGLLCARDGVCRAAGDPVNKAQPDLGAPIAQDDATGGSDVCVTPTDFGTGGGTCPARTTALRLTKLVILPEGGLGKIAAAANPTIATDMKEGRIHIELWDDTTWVPFDAEGAAICSQIEPSMFPMTVPTFPVHSLVYDAKLDAGKTKLTGWASKQQIVASMKCELHAAAESLVEADLGPDKVSVVLEVELAP